MKEGTTNKQQYFLKTKTPPLVISVKTGGEAEIQTYSLRLSLMPGALMPSKSPTLCPIQVCWYLQSM